MGFIRKAFPTSGIGLAAEALKQKKKAGATPGIQPLLTLSNQPVDRRATSLVSGRTM